VEGSGLILSGIRPANERPRRRGKMAAVPRRLFHLAFNLAAVVSLVLCVAAAVLIDLSRSTA
jgi:hypothetical protein